MQWQQLDLSLSGLRRHYQNKDFTPEALVAHLLEQMDAFDAQADNTVWIERLDLTAFTPYFERLKTLDFDTTPLWGVPFAIKDNIDLENVPTTAACPAFAYTPSESAFAVKQCLNAGAIPLGKTNLDQFATGLVGVRSPYGLCRNALNPEYISGGSSSGSAVAVAKHWVSFSLGTDTAGSGRVPAALNNLVGLKPSKGLISTRGVVPACRSLDCVSIFAQNTDDANTVLDVMAVFDPEDAYARANTFANGPRYYRERQGALTIGVPQEDQLAFFGDQESEALFLKALETLQQAGVTIKTVDFSAFQSAAELLYQGPWVAERYVATESLIETHPEALLPVIHTIVGGGIKPKATDAFKAQYALQACHQKAQSVLAQVDAMLTPTYGPLYSVDELLEAPIVRNTHLGYYTNFMNLLDCAAVALPTALRQTGVGFGVTLFANAFEDKKLLSIAAHWQNLFKLAPGESGVLTVQGDSNTLLPTDTVDVVVCGAHLAGFPLNWQLTERGAHLKSKTQTSARYALYALPGGPVPRPALVRDADCATAIEVEVWTLPIVEFGSFVANIPAPLGIGKVELADGTWCAGFICEGEAVKEADNISHLGGWRAYQSQA